MKKINNYHLFILILIVFILNTILFRSIDLTFAQFPSPPGTPGEQTTNIVVNPLQEDLDIGTNNIIGEGGINVEGDINANGTICDGSACINMLKSGTYQAQLVSSNELNLYNNGDAAKLYINHNTDNNANSDVDISSGTLTVYGTGGINVDGEIIQSSNSLYGYQYSQGNDSVKKYHYLGQVGSWCGSVRVSGSFESHSINRGSGSFDINFSRRDGFKSTGYAGGIFGGSVDIELYEVNDGPSEGQFGPNLNVYLVTGLYAMTNIDIETTGCHSSINSGNFYPSPIEDNDDNFISTDPYYKLSTNGFSLSGPINVAGDINVSGVLFDGAGNSTEWNAAYSNINMLKSGTYQAQLVSSNELNLYNNGDAAKLYINHNTDNNANSDVDISSGTLTVYGTGGINVEGDINANGTICDGSACINMLKSGTYQAQLVSSNELNLYNNGDAAKLYINHNTDNNANSDVDISSGTLTVYGTGGINVDGEIIQSSNSLYGYQYSQGNDSVKKYHYLGQVGSWCGSVRVSGSFESHSINRGSGSFDINFSRRDGFKSTGYAGGIFGGSVDIELYEVNDGPSEGQFGPNLNVYLVTGLYAMTNIDIETTGCHSSINSGNFYPSPIEDNDDNFISTDPYYKLSTNGFSLSGPINVAGDINVSGYITTDNVGLKHKRITGTTVGDWTLVDHGISGSNDRIVSINCVIYAPPITEAGGYIEPVMSFIYATQLYIGARGGCDYCTSQSGLHNQPFSCVLGYTE